MSGTVAIKVSATDDVAVVKTYLYIDGALKRSVNGGSLSYNWNTSRVAKGAHTASAKAIDASNQSTVTTVKVNKY